MRKSAIVDLLNSPFYNVQRGSRSKLKGENYKEKKMLFIRILYVFFMECIIVYMLHDMYQ